MKKNDKTNIGIIGLGYVGLPLAVAFSKIHNVIGYDIDTKRVNELKKNKDTTREIKDINFSKMKNLFFTSDSKNLKQCNIFIITVPTPVNSKKEPDLKSLKKASKTIGKVVKKEDIVVVESTVYPGVTEDIVVPSIESETQLKWKKDFFIAYSPERINPGDNKHKLTTIKKIVGADNKKTLRKIKTLYQKIVKAGVFAVSSIKVAETSKAIENAQRDINIAFVNEIVMICDSLKIDSNEVMEAAKTKWNFLDFSPGLVGGHCIGVDPFYLAKAAMKAGHLPEVILAGRKINDSMSFYLFRKIKKLIKKKSRVLILGMAFKENVNDTRNSKSIELARFFKKNNYNLDCYDPLVNKTEIRKNYDLSLKVPKGKYDCLIVTIGHAEFKKFSKKEILALLNKRALIVDVRGVWKKINFPPNLKVWNL